MLIYKWQVFNQLNIILDYLNPLKLNNFQSLILLFCFDDLALNSVGWHIGGLLPSIVQILIFKENKFFLFLLFFQIKINQHRFYSYDAFKYVYFSWK